MSAIDSIKMQLGYKTSAVEIPCLFIDHYMTGCLPVYPLIYIFSLRRLLDGGGVSFHEISERFQLTEGDVINAWRHWEKMGLVQIDNPDVPTKMSITFMPIRAPKIEDKTDKINEPEQQPLSLLASSRPHYTVQELTVYRNQSKDIEHLFKCAEKNLGKLLTYNDMNIIFGFHDWLRLPVDVIEFLLTYCTEHDHRNLRYIEKCALDWVDQGIDDVEKALEYVQTFDKGYRTILRHMGQSTGYPTPSHRKYIDKWVQQWNMPLELIIEACDRCVVQIDKPKFSYVDKILSDWHKKSITTLHEVKAEDAKFAKTKEKVALAPVKTSARAKPNRFANFNQRDNDYTRYEQLERAYLAQKLKV